MDRLEDSLRSEVTGLREDLAELRRDLVHLTERVARIEGALSGPWRPPAGETTEVEA